MPHIRYEIHPDDPVATESARLHAYLDYFLGFIFLWGSIGSVIYYIWALVSSIKDKPTEDMLYSILLIVALSVFDFFVCFGRLDKELKLIIAKKFFLFSFFGLVELSCVVCMITAANNYFVDDVVFNIALIVAIIFLVLLIGYILKIKDVKLPKFRLFTDNNELNKEILTAQNKQTQTIIPSPNIKPIQENEVPFSFCHKCGKKVKSESLFCSFCGTKLSN